MPITVKKQTIAVAPKVVEVGKIAELDINVKNGQIRVVLEYGTISNSKLNVVDRQMILLEGDEFLSIAAVKTKGNLSIYDELAEVTYAWLATNKKLKYSV